MHVKGKISWLNLKDPLLSCQEINSEIHLEDEFVLTNDARNKWFLTRNKTVVCMQGAICLEKQYHIYGSALKHVHDFLLKPLSSSNLHIYSAKQEPLLEPKLYGLDEVLCKLFAIKYQNEIVLFPLLHTLDYMSKFK